MEDLKRPLNYTHEYQIVWIEPNDGSHVFEIQLGKPHFLLNRHFCLSCQLTSLITPLCCSITGTPFTIPSATKPDSTARYLKVRDHALNLLFQTPLLPLTWHNFAVQVDWDRRTLAVLFSYGALPLKHVTGVKNNNSTASGTAGQGDYHWGVLKVRFF